MSGWHHARHLTNNTRLAGEEVRAQRGRAAGPKPHRPCTQTSLTQVSNWCECEREECLTGGRGWGAESAGILPCIAGPLFICPDDLPPPPRGSGQGSRENTMGQSKSAVCQSPGQLSVFSTSHLVPVPRLGGSWFSCPAKGFGTQEGTGVRQDKGASSL